MTRTEGQNLTAVLVDYDNIYLALKRKSEEAAKRFAKDASLWIREIESGALITPTNAPPTNARRRIVLNRCYGNPVPRRNNHDNSTDMSSFPFVRHHFLRAGFEVVDCPPLTAQLKNSSDIRMVMDVRDFLLHETYFDEFIVLSGDADFTPVLHRLRAHARRTVIFADDHTAAPYTAISDGEIREQDLISLLVEGRIASTGQSVREELPAATQEQLRQEIIGQVVGAIGSSAHPIPLEALADRAVRALGHEKTAGSAWADAGSFRELLAQSLPEGIRLSEQAPFFVYDASRQIPPPAREPRETQREALTAAPAAAADTQRAVAGPVSTAPPVPSEELRQTRTAPQAAPSFGDTILAGAGAPSPQQAIPAARLARAVGLSALAARPAAPAPSLDDGRHGIDEASLPVSHEPAPQQPVANQQPAASNFAPAPVASEPVPAPASPGPEARGLTPRSSEAASALQQSIARIHDACQAPPLSPPEYRLLFELSAREISERGLLGAQTINNITHRAQEHGLDIRRDDVRFVLEVVSEADPWFEQGASANLFAGRFRNFVVARCRSQGLDLSADELDLIEAWFVSGSVQSSETAAAQQPAQAAGQPPAPPAPRQDAMQAGADPRLDAGEDDFPRIVRTRLRG